MARDRSPERSSPADGGVNRLVTSLDKLISKVNHEVTKTDLPTFEGKSYFDWLVLKRASVNTAQNLSASDILTGVTCALRDAAHEAVVGLLEGAAPLAALDARYGRPGLVVMHEVAAVPALPKVSYDGRDHGIFGSRVRNCVGVVRLLDQPDYLFLLAAVTSTVVGLCPFIC